MDFRGLVQSVISTVSQVLPECHLCGAPGAQICVECHKVACHKHAYTNVGAMRSVCSACVAPQFPWASSDMLVDEPEDWPYTEQPWEILGIQSTATVDEINRAHRDLSLVHHPDRGGDPQRQTVINKAREAMLRMRV